MKTRVLAFCLLAPSLLLSSCGRGTGAPSRVSYSESGAAEIPPTYDGLMLARAPGSGKALLMGIAGSGDSAWVRSEKASLGSWDELPSVDLEPKSAGSYSTNLLTCGSKLVLVWGGQTEDYDYVLCSLVSSDDGQSWVQGKTVPVRPTADDGIVPYGSAQAGPTRLYASSPFDGKQINIYQASADAGDWQMTRVDFPEPEGVPSKAVLDYEGFKPELVVDAEDRLHFLREVHVREGDKTTYGSLYCRSDDGKSMTCTFIAAGRDAALAADPKDADRLVMAMLPTRPSKEDSKGPEALDLAVSTSEDGGDSWSSPFVIDAEDTRWTSVDTMMWEDRILVVARAARPNGDNRLDTYAYDSVDGGRTWSKAVALPVSPSAGYLHEKTAVLLDKSAQKFVTATFQE